MKKDRYAERIKTDKAFIFESRGTVFRLTLKINIL